MYLNSNYAAAEDITTSAIAMMFSAMAGFLIFLLITGLAITVLIVISWWKIFTKAGKPGWASIVPVYNFWTMLEIVELPGWISLIMLLTAVPYLNVLAAIGIFGLNIYVAIKIAPLFGKETAFAIGLILLPAIFYPILAFGKNEYMGGYSAVEPAIAPEPPVEE